MKKLNETVKKLNLGCGEDYRVGWVNLDFNKEVKADVYHNLEKFPYPFKDDEFDLIYIDNALEHVQNVLKCIEELWRISKKGAEIIIYVPHFTGIYATKHLAHYHQFGIGTFDIYKKISGLDKGFNGERYGKARFEIIEQKLLYFHHNSVEISLLSKLPINRMFNFSRKWQLILEKFFPLKFDEIRYKLKVLK
ncbi:MAG: methyltransferase domain-containing protein [Candidatus Nanoarchaeia archaeon]|nr:methyltransferase domain-containing protein [Candidatus Nanoarchaeia archaeon]MDD5358157.1 methyltransferase domain-containing protein [Candidatus Nanoarchaeia archaeon]MDD5589344.1 methyltransferase domain-containing protein [Candidatus Nanoarchaeia archaeon]